MNCAEFWNGMPELSGGISGHEHLKACAECAAAMERQGLLVSGLRAMANDMRAVAAPPRLEANLLDAYRREMAAVPRTATGRWMPIMSPMMRPAMPSSIMAWIAAGAAAAILTATVWIAPWRHSAVPPPHHSASTGIELAALTDDTQDDDAFIQRGFIQLPNAERVDPNDDVNVVQMELSRSVMLAVGLEVSPDRVSEPVEAEVMLGPDGLPRAVRFLDDDGGTY